MSEQEPLLATTPNDPDVEAAHDDPPSNSRLSKYRARLGEALEAKITHKIVIALVRFCLSSFASSSVVARIVAQE